MSFVIVRMGLFKRSIFAVMTPASLIAIIVVLMRWFICRACWTDWLGGKIVAVEALVITLELCWKFLLLINCRLRPRPRATLPAWILCVRSTLWLLVSVAKCSTPWPKVAQGPFATVKAAGR